MAPLLAERGYRLLLIARSKVRLDRLASALPPPPAGAPHRVASIDLSSPREIEPAIREALDSGDSPELLVNCAGAGSYRPFLDCSVDEALRLMNLNYFAATELIRLLLPGMLARRRGHVINVASISSKIGPWGHSAYAPSKAALVSLTQTLAAEHPGSGVHFSYVNPGIVKTAYFESPDVAPLWQRVHTRAIPVDVVARRIARLLDRPRLELCVPWHYRFIELIGALHPGLANRIVAWQSRPCETPGRTRLDERRPRSAPVMKPQGGDIATHSDSLHPA